MSPADRDAERAVLSASMTSTVARKRAGKVLTGPDFHWPQHQAVWDAMRRLDQHRKSVDPVTVAALLAGDRFALETLPDIATAFAHPDQVEHHAAIVRSWATKRRLASEATAVAHHALGPDVNADGYAASVATRFAAIRDAGVGEDLHAKTLTELIEEPDDPYDWVIPDLLERSDRFVLTGLEGLGKSMWLRQVVIAAAAGIHPFENRRIPVVKAVIIDAENTERHVKRKVRPLHTVACLRGDDPGQRVMVECPGRLDITRDRDLARIHQLLDAMQPDVIVIGPLYRLVPRAVQTDDEAAPLLTALDTIRDRGIALLLEAHAGHSIGKGGRRDMRPRGSSALLGWPEFGYGLSPSEGGETGDVDLLSWRGDRDERHWPRRFGRGGTWPWTPVDRGAA